MHVSAKDKGTGTEKSIVISGGSSLSKEDIERMVREAEEHAAEDKARREPPRSANQAETLAYSIDKLITENDDKLPEDVKTEVKADVDALKTALAGEDDEAVKTAFDKLNQSSPSSARPSTPPRRRMPQPALRLRARPRPVTLPPRREDVIDAEVVDDEDEKK